MDHSRIRSLFPGSRPINAAEADVRPSNCVCVRAFSSAQNPCDILESSSCGRCGRKIWFYREERKKCGEGISCLKGLGYRMCVATFASASNIVMAFH
jgi:hypothetical protein